MVQTEVAVEIVHCKGTLQDGKHCNKWLGVLAGGQFTMAYHNRNIRTRGSAEIDIDCERCGHTNIVVTGS